MTSRKRLAAALLACVLSVGNASKVGRQLERPKDWYGPESYPGAIHRRQTSVIVVPPRTSLIPQPTTSLNYWWPYGPNGVNPTSTSMLALPSTTSNLENTDIMDETSMENESTSTTTTSTLPSSRSSSSSTTTAGTTTSDASATPTSDAIEIPESRDGAFKIVSLLPLFIILGVLLVATVAGWTYGRCVLWCRRRREPIPGGPSIGGKPYECSGYDSDPSAAMGSLGVGWVDASRIHSRYDLGPDTYHVVQTDHSSEGFGAPSKSKAHAQGTQGWFRYTLSGRKGPVNSPSGEKGLNQPFVCDRRMYASIPAGNLGATSQDCSSISSKSQSPKLLRVINGSPSTPGTRAGLRSPATSAQPTPHLSASRHASIRRNIMNKVRADDKEDLLAATALVGAFRGFDGEEDEHEEDWASFSEEPHKVSPVRRYSSTSPNSRSPVWPRDPEIHRARMRRLRAMAQSTQFAQAGSEPPLSASKTMDTAHPLPPTPAVLLSPPLQPHLFFTSPSPDPSQDATSLLRETSFVRSNVSRNLNRRSMEPHSSKNDPFGPIVPLASGRSRTQKRTARPQRPADMTETLPLSPELRGAAMTRLDEIMQSNWSLRNLAGAPQSPTLFGALNPSFTDHAHGREKGGCSGIEEVLTDRSGEYR